VCQMDGNACVSGQVGGKACEPGGLEPMCLKWLGKLVYYG
jgi:hypothetical protein